MTPESNSAETNGSDPNGAEAYDSNHFDRWSESYDADASGSETFPLAGYEGVLRAVVEQAEVRAGMSVLDLGTGTGSLAGLFLEESCEVWGTDFSERMIEKARAKYPGANFEFANLSDGPATSFPAQYDRIVSAYAFHHLELQGKVALITKLLSQHLRPGGKLLIADVAFPSAWNLLQARERLAEAWDPSEHYWPVAEIEETLESIGIELEFRPVSFCAGVFELRLTAEGIDWP